MTVLLRVATEYWISSRKVPFSPSLPKRDGMKRSGEDLGNLRRMTVRENVKKCRPASFE